MWYVADLLLWKLLINLTNAHISTFLLHNFSKDFNLNVKIKSINKVYHYYINYALREFVYIWILKKYVQTKL